VLTCEWLDVDSKLVRPQAQGHMRSCASYLLASWKRCCEQMLMHMKEVCM